MIDKDLSNEVCTFCGRLYGDYTKHICVTLNENEITKIQALEKENGELKESLKAQNDLIVKYENQCSFENTCELLKSLEAKNKLLVDKLEKAKKAIGFIDYQFRCSLGDSDDMRESIKFARQTLKELED